MKKLLTFLTLLTLFFGVSWAATMTYTPTSAAGEGTLTGGPSDLTLTNTHSGGNSMQTNQGLQITTGKSPFAATISGLTSSYKVTKIVVTYCTNNKAGKGTISAKIGDTQVGTTFNVTAPNGGGTSLKTATLYDNASGMPFVDHNNFTINIICTTNSVYLNKVEIDYEANSGAVIPTVQTPVITLNPASGPYYVGDEVTASFTCGTEGAAISYQIDGGAWTAYNNSPVTIPSTTAGTVTIKAKATKTDYNDSGEATETVTFVERPTTLTSLVAVNALDDGSSFMFDAQTVVLGKYNKQLYIVMPDNSAGTLVYGDSNWSSDFTFGKDVNSGWSGTKTTYNDKPEVTSPTNFTLPGTTTEVTPIEITSNSDLTKANFGRYAVIRNVQVAANGSFSELTTYDQFHLSFTDFEAGRYDVYGVIGWNNGVGQFMPLQYEEHVAAYTITVNQPAAGGSISADAETADAGEEITLTATPAAGYQLASWTVKDADDNDVTVTDNKFTMPASNVTVTAAFEAIKYAVNVNVTPANSGEVWVQGGCTVENNVSVSTVGTTVTVKLHSKTNYQVDGISVVDADNNEITATLTSTEADGNTYTFVMPASAVTVTGKFHAYVPDVYFLAGELSNWDNGVKMTYDSENNKYNLRVYFSDEYGYFRFRAGDNTYASGAEGDWWGLNGSTAGETATLYQGSTKRFRVPAGIYDIEVGQVFDDPTTSSNPNWWGQTTVKVTKVEPTLTFTPAAGEIVSGSSVSVSSNLYDLLSAINSEVAENDVTNMVKTDGEYAASVTLDAAATVTGRAKYGYIEQTATAEYTIMQENNSTQYQLITSTDDLVAGKKYIVVYESGNKAMGQKNGSNYYRGATAVEIDAQHITDIADLAVSELILGGEENAWTFQVKDNEKYLSYATSSAYLTEADIVGDNEKFTISFDGDDALIVSNAANTRSIRYNNTGSGRFGLYVTLNNQGSANTSQPIVQLYRQVEQVVTQKVETPVITPGTGTYASAQTVEITCSTADATIWYKYGNMTEYAEYTDALTISENTTLSAYATKDGYTDSEVATATYTFSELSTDVFTLVTSEAQLVEGNEYIIVAANDAHDAAFGSISSNSGEKATGFTIKSDLSEVTLTTGSDVNIFTLGKSGNDANYYWTFMQKNNKYLYAESNGNRVNEDGGSSYSNLFYIHINPGNSNAIHYAIIQAGGDHQILYNGSSFRHWQGSNLTTSPDIYKNVYLYTRGSATPEYTEVTLAELCQNGVTTEGSNKYVISDRLVAVYADLTKGVLWCKDEGNASIFPTSIKEGQVDYLYNDTEAQNKRDWDQSNWIALHFTTPTSTNGIDEMLRNAQNHYIKAGTIKGTYFDDVNYALRMDNETLDLVTPADEGGNVQPDYIPNVYCTTNFLPDNLNIWGDERDGAITGANSQNYFFMNPKIQEVCEVTYAQWDAFNLCFTVPSNSGFDGAFYVGWGYNVLGDLRNSLQDEHIYKFQAIVQRSDKNSYGPKNVTTPFAGFTVYPVDLDGTGSDITTAINTVDVNGKAVKSVKYVNVAGMVSDKPFSGVNIVVTEYTDGSRTTSKMLRK